MRRQKIVAMANSVAMPGSHRLPPDGEVGPGRGVYAAALLAIDAVVFVVILG